MKKKPVSAKTFLLSASFVSGLALLMAAQSVADSFLSHPSFLVREVEVRWPATVSKSAPTRFRLQPPLSIYRVELDALSRAFRQRYPTAEVQRVDRVLPNRVVVTLYPRQVVAQLFTGRSYYPVSDGGRVVGRGQPRPFPGFPVLQLERVAEPLSLGQDLDRFGFWKASELLSTLQRDRGIAGHRVAKLSVRDSDLLVDLEAGAQLRFSSDRLGDGWRRLWELIAHRRDLLDRAQYVDLRYDDPLIGERGRKPKGRK